MISKNVICLKHGVKYSFDYVNRLYSMVKRHSTYEIDFYCITEDPSNLHPEIKILPLPSNLPLQGWWYKPYLFSKNFPVIGDLLFIDLDVVIIKNIDCFWDYEPNKFCIIRDFTRSQVSDWQRFNSSVFRLKSRSLPNVWENLINDLDQSKRMHGDQDWIYSQVKHDYAYWPDDWCQSYKWEIRNRKEIIGSGQKRTFATILHEPKIKLETKILVFHGDPKPEQVKDPIVVDNWK